MNNSVSIKFWNNLSAEATFLLKCSQENLSADESAELHSLLNENFNWELFKKLALRSSLGPLCYKSLVAANNPLVPKSIILYLENLYNKVLTQNIIILHAFDQLREIFISNKIPFIPLKGVDLIHHLYNDPGVRGTSDIDILIKKSDLKKVRAIFKENNYHESIVDEYEFIGKLTKNPSPYQYSKNGVNVDLHILLNRADEHAIGIEQFWLSAKQKNQTYEYELDPDFKFLHLCLHLHKHLYGISFKFIWLYDLMLMRGHGNLNTERIQQLATSHHFFTELNEVLELLQMIYNKSFFGLERNQCEALNEDITQKILNFLKEKPLPKTRITSFEYLILETSHLSAWNKLRVALGRIFPSPRYLNMRFKSGNNYALGLYRRYFHAFKGY
ncbi:MAG: hypothetical protein RLZZ71_167 [Bacteroidota bacterium]